MERGGGLLTAKEAAGYLRISLFTLRKIEQHAAFDVSSRMEAFFIESPMAGRMSRLFSTHPSVDERVQALRRYAGAAQDVQNRLLQGR